MPAECSRLANQPSSYRILSDRNVGTNMELACIGVWPMGLRGAKIFQIAIFGQKNQVIFGKNHLHFRASNGKKYSGKRLQPPERNLSRTPMLARIARFVRWQLPHVA